MGDKEAAVGSLGAAARALFGTDFLDGLQEKEDVGPAQRLYPDLGKIERQPIKPRPEGGTGLSNAEAGAVLYPDQTGRGRYPRSEDNKVLDCIRDNSGNILLQNQYHGDLAAMDSGHANELAGADLSDVPLAGKSLDHGSIHDARLPSDCSSLSAKWTNARNLDARAVSLVGANLSMSDIRGMQVDRATDISGCDFTGCRIDAETLAALKKCKGAATAKGLALNDWKGVKGVKNG